MEISSSDMLMLSSPTQGIGGSFLSKAKESASKVASKVSEVKAKAEVVAKKAVEKGKELQAKATELADKAVKASEDLQKKAEQLQQQAVEVRKQYDEAKEKAASVGASLKTPAPTTDAETIASDVQSTTAPVQYLRRHSRRR
jgi:phage shock protein A